jgi:hypothetical protein
MVFPLFVGQWVHLLMNPWPRRERGVQTESKTGEIFWSFLAFATESRKIFDLFCLKCAEGQRP